MALSDKNILITPNIGVAADPKIVFSGADAGSTAQNITLTVYPTNSGTLSFDGSTGQLFSITNSMTGTIYSVNDVSGIPSIEVLDTGLIKLAQYSGNVVLGSATDTGLAKLQVTGSLSVTGNTIYSTNSRSIYGPNTTWSSYLYIGGDGITGITRTGSLASVVTTNGNLHLDSGSDKAMYLNHYSGTGGIQFGNGASGTTATMSAAGVLSAANVLIGGNQVLHAGNYNNYSPTLTGTGASGTWAINVTGNAATVTNGVYTSGDAAITSGKKIFYSENNTFINTTAADDKTLAVFQQTAGADAYMSFHISGDYAAYFGLGGAENDLVYGGWSAGATRHRILHSGNYTAYTISPSVSTNFTAPQRPALGTETAPTTNSLTWNLTTTSIVRINLNANITTLTLTGTLSTYAGYQYQAIVRYNGGTAITWPATVKFSGGTAPTLTGTSGKVDVFNFVVASNDGGTTFFMLCTGSSQNI